MTIEDDDIVMREFRAPRKAVITIGQAASEYFDWCEQQRERRARMLAEIGEDASPPKKTSPPFDKNARAAVTQFVSHVTPVLPVAKLTPNGVAAFQETIGTNAADTPARLLPVKEFLRFCWKHGYIEANLGNHLRVESTEPASAAALDNDNWEHEEAERFDHGCPPCL